MESFVGTLTFLLPGVMVYFWLQAFGVNPVVKHSPAEFTAISALLWLPVSLLVILLYNLPAQKLNLVPIWTVDELRNASGSLLFLAIFLLLSAVISFVISVLWSKWGHVLLQKIINIIRKWKGVAAFSETTSVWDEVFGKNDPQVIEIGKMGQEEKGIKGCVNKASRPLELERNLYLGEIDFFEDLIKENNIRVTNIFFDIKSGTYIKVFDPDQIKKAQEADSETCPTS